MNPIYNFNRESYENLSHGELWDIWREIKKASLEELEEREIRNLSAFADMMARSFDTV